MNDIWHNILDGFMCVCVVEGHFRHGFNSWIICDTNWKEVYICSH